MEPGDFFCISLCIVPFLAPALAGSRLLAKGPDDDLARMAGLLTLKPILTTPMWIAIAAILGDPYQYRSSFLVFMPAIVAILPGACLTLVAAVKFRSTLSGPRAGKARLLLALDCVRWLNSLLLGTASSGIEPFEFLCFVNIPLGLAMPTIFASVAWQVVTSDAGSCQPVRRLAPETSDQKVAPSPVKAEVSATQLSPPIGWRFWLRWVLMSAVGWAVDRITPGGVGVGVMQWLVLRPLIYGAGWWVLASVAGGVVVWVTGLAARSWDLFAAEFESVIWLTLELVAAAVVGVIQWLVLRRQVYRAAWWIAASIVGGVAGWAVQWAVMRVIYVVDALAVLFCVFLPIIGAMIGTINGAITGAAMVWLLRHPIPQVADQQASTRFASPD